MRLLHAPFLVLVLPLLLTLAGPGLALAQDRVTFGGEVWVRPGETVEEVVAWGGDVRVDGTVLGDTVVFGGRLELGPQAVIHGDQVVVGGKVVVDPQARVQGERVMVGGRITDAPAPPPVPEIAPTPLVPPVPPVPPAPLGKEDLEEGSTPSDLPSGGGEGAEERRSWGSISAWRLGAWMGSALGLFALGMVLVAVWPDGVRNLRRTVQGSARRAAVVGFLFTLACIALTPLLVISVVGIPVVVVLWMVLPLMWMVGMVGVAERLGAALPDRARVSREVMLLVGAALVALPVLLPAPLAVTVELLIGAVAVGATVLSRLGRRPYA